MNRGPPATLGGVSNNRNIDAQIAQLAARQHGHVTRRVLLALGMAPRTIDARIVAGQLIRVHAGVYALGYRRVEPIARAAAAVLAAGPGAALSHDSAAALWGLRRWPRAPEVTAPRCVRRPGITAHRSRTLTAAEVTTQLGVRTTTAGRALRDIRPRLTARQFTRLVNRARLERLIAADVAAEFLGRSGNPTRSGLEDEFLRFLARHGLPQPQVDARVCGHEVDALFPAARLIVELDDYATHGDRATFDSDRERDTAHAAAGYQTIRLTRERLTDETATILDRLLIQPRVLPSSYGLLDEL